MTLKSRICAFVIAGLLLASPLAADTVDFTQLPGEELGSSSVTVDGVTFRSDTELYNLSATHFPDAGGAICGFDPDSFSCHNDLKVNFNGQVRRLRLSVLGFDQADIASITLFRGKANLGSVPISHNHGYRLDSFGKVTRIVIHVSSTAHNIAFGKFQFRRVPPPAKAHHDGKPNRTQRN